MIENSLLSVFNKDFETKKKRYYNKTTQKKALKKLNPLNTLYPLVILVQNYLVLRCVLYADMI